MLQKQSNVPTSLRNKKIDAEELAIILQRLPVEEREKIYYMIQGVQLIHNAEQRKVC